MPWPLPFRKFKLALIAASCVAASALFIAGHRATHFCTRSGRECSLQCAISQFRGSAILGGERSRDVENDGGHADQAIG